MQSALLHLASAVVLAACSAPPTVERSAAESPAILQAVIQQGWREGPFAGQVCLDPRTLPDFGAADTSGKVWDSTVLDAVQSDTMVAIAVAPDDSSARGRRHCEVRMARARVRFGLPQVRADTAVLAYAMFAPQTEDAAKWRNAGRVKLARQPAGWRIVGYPDMHFQELPAPR